MSNCRYCGGNGRDCCPDEQAAAKAAKAVFRNLTPHRVTILLSTAHAVHIPTGTVITAAEAARLPAHELHYPESWSIAPEPTSARVGVDVTQAGEHAGIPLLAVQYGEVTGLPEPVPGTIYIVSQMVRTARPDRVDLASPGELVRGADGQPIGCRGLVVNRPRCRVRVCRRCGDRQDPSTGMGVHDSHDGGDGPCGDLHDWVQVTQ